jgi:hypothetical protein
MKKILLTLLGIICVSPVVVMVVIMLVSMFRALTFVEIFGTFGIIGAFILGMTVLCNLYCRD